MCTCKTFYFCDNDVRCLIKPLFDHHDLIKIGDSDFVAVAKITTKIHVLRIDEFNVVATKSRDYISIWRLGQSVAGRYRLHVATWDLPNGIGHACDVPASGKRTTRCSFAADYGRVLTAFFGRCRRLRATTAGRAACESTKTCYAIACDYSLFSSTTYSTTARKTQHDVLTGVNYAVIYTRAFQHLRDPRSFFPARRTRTRFHALREIALHNVAPKYTYFKNSSKFAVHNIFHFT